ncbi:ketohexokinase-like isoform X2 [Bacillus rossius redtenbacheri]|uniref:ketohexokinase-like isoform X2 n=1 Tax=Bacillus rossius redtenbacheri TaxID=93214 RepID=UPI002FDD3160
MAESRCLTLSSTFVIEQGSQTSAFLPADDSLQAAGSDQSLTNRDLKVLSVGIAVLDSVYVVNSYPVEEDVKELAPYHRWHRGGNASNTATALAILGARTEFLGTLSSSKIASFVVDDFARRGISTEHCVMYDQLSGPLAVVLTNRQNGSRTIIHTDSDLPELSLEDFRRLDLSQYSWIHFEGRNVQTVARMIEDVDCWNDRQTTGVKPMPVRVSVELERPRAWQEEIMAVAPLADVVFVSKDFAHFMKWEGVDQTLAAVAEHVKPRAQLPDHQMALLSSLRASLQRKCWRPWLQGTRSSAPLCTA